MRGPQDLGGLPAGPIEPIVHEHEPTHWEKRIDAMMMLLFDPKRQLARSMNRVACKRRSARTITIIPITSGGCRRFLAHARKGVFVRKSSTKNSAKFVRVWRLNAVERRISTGDKVRVIKRNQPGHVRTPFMFAVKLASSSVSSGRSPI